MPIEDMHVHIQQEPQQPKVEEQQGDKNQKAEVTEEKPQTGKTAGGHTVTVMTKTPMSETDKSKLINSAKTKLDGVAKELGLKNATFMLNEGGQIVAITTKSRRLTLNFGAHVEAGKASLTKEKSSLEAEKGRLTKLASTLKGNPIDDPKTKASQDKIDARMNEINKTLADLEPRLAQANEKAALLTKVVSQFNESIKGEKKPESSTPEQKQVNVDEHDLALAAFSGSQSSDTVSKAKVDDKTNTAAPPKTEKTPEKTGVRFADEAGKELTQEHKYVKGSAPDPTASTTKGADQLKSLRERAPIGSHREASKAAETVSPNASKGAEQLKSLHERAPLSSDTDPRISKTIGEHISKLEEKIKQKDDELTKLKVECKTLENEIKTIKTSEGDTTKLETELKAKKDSIEEIKKELAPIKSEFHRSKPIAEIFITESSYQRGVNDLVTVMDGLEKMMYPDPKNPAAKNDPTISRFKDYRLLNEASKRIVSMFTEAYQSGDSSQATEKLAKVYASPEFKQYTELMGKCSSHYETVLAGLNTLRSKNPEIAAYLTKMERDLPSIQGQNVQQVLIMPIQRMPRHVLLTGELVKNTPQDAPHYQSLRETLTIARTSATRVDTLANTSKEMASLANLKEGPQLNVKDYSQTILNLFENNKISGPKNAETFFEILGSKGRDPESRLQGLKLVMNELKNLGVLEGKDSSKNTVDNQAKAARMRAVLAANPGILRGLHAEIGALEKPAFEKRNEKFLGLLSLGSASRSESMLKEINALRDQCRILEDQAEKDRGQHKTEQKKAA